MSGKRGCVTYNFSAIVITVGVTSGERVSRFLRQCRVNEQKLFFMAPFFWRNRICQWSTRKTVRSKRIAEHL